jgi:hypothetical protein
MKRFILVAIALCACTGKRAQQANESTKTVVCESRRLTMASEGESKLELPTVVTVMVPTELRALRKATSHTRIEFRRNQYPSLFCTYGPRPGGEERLPLARCDRRAAAGSTIESDSIVAAAEPRGPDDVLEFLLCTAPQGYGMDPRRPTADHGSELPTPPPGSDYPWTLAPFAFTEGKAQEYRQFAEADDTAKGLLGDRFAYVMLNPVDPPKGEEPKSYHAVVVFYSYDYHHAVNVRMEDGVVKEVTQSSEVPPDGKSERDEAILLARGSDELKGRVNDLDGGAMLATLPADADEKLSRKRVIDVRFYEPATHISHFFATVNLTDRVVVAAGEVGKMP